MGRPRKHTYRELLNAMFYLVRTTCQWRNRPKDFAPGHGLSSLSRLGTERPAGGDPRALAATCARGQRSSSQPRVVILDR
ncbi:MAG: transposase [Verrucomicrobia bacterium]|nr:transposase [Verrucomicrobiota bacterium]